MRHRTNNLVQTLVSALRFKAEAITDPGLKAQLIEACGAAASLQNHLQVESDRDRIDFNAYLRDVARLQTCLHGRPDITIQVEPAQVMVSAKVAPTLALIADELLQNALQHAFPGGRSGTIRIGLVPGPARSLIVKMDDDGVGLPAKPGGPAWSGMRLIEELSRQLGGRLKVECTAGTKVRLRLRL